MHLPSFFFLLFFFLSSFNYFCQVLLTFYFSQKKKKKITYFLIHTQSACNANLQRFLVFFYFRKRTKKICSWVDSYFFFFLCSISHIIIMSVDELSAAAFHAIHSAEDGLVCQSSSNEFFSSLPSANFEGAKNASRDLEKENSTDLTLTSEMIEKSLSVLGHNLLGQIVFSCSTLSNLDLGNISRLSSYVFLQKVNLDNNKLTSLEALQSLPYLVFLSASHNKLTDGCFSSLRGCSSNLEHLHLNHNRLTSLQGLHYFPFLINFSASCNAITELRAENFSNLQCLMRVELRKNRVSKVEPQVFAGAQHIRSLDLSHNCIENMMFISYITGNLESLYLSNNKITRIDYSLSLCSALVILDLKDNLISSISGLQNVCPGTSLRKLYVIGNPFKEIASQESKDQQSAVVSSEITMEDLPYSPVNLEGLKQLAVEEQKESPSICPTLPYAALATKNTFGRIKNVVNAANKFHLAAASDKLDELRRIPLVTQVRLRILSFLPHLSVLDGIIVSSEDVARAAAYFEVPQTK